MYQKEYIVVVLLFLLPFSLHLLHHVELNFAIINTTKQGIFALILFLVPLNTVSTMPITIH